MLSGFREIEGLVFVLARTGEEFGPLRGVEVGECNSGPEEATPFAVDECGNAFLQQVDGKIVFWDHETSEQTTLAESLREFAAACRPPEPVELDESQIKKVWIDPEFAKQFGIDVPKDGWIKKSD